MIPSYPKTPHWPESLSVHRDDHYHCDPSFFVGQDVVITEKLDGGIATINDNKVYARSSGNPTAQPWFSYLKSVTLPKLHSLPLNLCLIGEDLYGIHSIEYHPLPDTFFLFHVLDRYDDNIGTENTKDDWFWDWAAVVETAQRFKLHHVPVLFEGFFDKTEQITEWFFDNISKPSVLGPVREGFVMRVRDWFMFDKFGQHVCKFVRANHVQTTSHWTKTWKPAKLIK